MYDFSRLNPQSFQSLVESLAIAEFGLPGQVFSSGPDGGRDFVFDGKIAAYDSKSWDGYLVLQVKYKEKLSTPTQDVEWLCGELRKERSAYLNQTKGRRRPEYFIIATNVSLSGADNSSGKGKRRTGGLSKVEAELRTWKTDIGITDFDIWPGRKIERLLDIHSGIRQSYQTWTTPGDVLAALLERQGMPNFSAAIQRAMLKAIARDQYIQLKDAGSLSDDTIRTSQIFVDLPYAREQEPQIEPDRRSVLKEIVHLAKSRFKLHERTPQRLPNLVVLLGGPGQGKSTVSKFAVQLHRAELLSRGQIFKNDPNTRELVPEILTHARNEDIDAVGTRYPVHVSLPRFADEFQQAATTGKKLSLLAFIAEQIAQDADTEVDRHALRQWLQDYPWIVFLDGLDEVPPSGARKPVVEAINGFLTEIASLPADVLVIVTTRPQGFNNDLSNDVWDHWHLIDLEPKRALTYASRLGQIRYPTDDIRRTQILEKMTHASKAPTTANIMRSPLQVAIMYVIADAGGAIPTARWSLFARYYDVLKQREMSKEGPARSIFESNLSHIDRLHAWAGLVLHTISESSGRATSSFSTDEFRKLLQECLKNGGVPDDEIETRVEQLLYLALDRLVLLASRQEGKISFDVRSLQEFMAASALTNGSDRFFNSRIRRLMKAAHWRHVIQIAASRCFTEGSHEHLITSLFGLLRELDTITEADSEAASGARLSLELLSDGIGIGSTRFRQMLATHAVDIIDQAFIPDADDLPRMMDDTTSTIILSKIEKVIASAGGKVNALAWSFAFRLSSEGKEVATSTICRNWPTDMEKAAEVVRFTALPFAPQVEELLSTYFGASQVKAVTNLRYIDRSANVENDSAVSSLARVAVDLSEAYQSRAQIDVLPEIGALELGVRMLGDGSPITKLSDDWIVSSQWSYLIAMKQFVNSPSATTLAAAIESLDTHEAWEDATSVEYLFPWPVATVLKYAKTPDERQLASEYARAQMLGDEELWREAEARWRKFGVSDQDILTPWTLGSLSDCGTVGVPMMRGMTTTISPDALVSGFRLLDLSAQIQQDERKENVRSFAFFGIGAGFDFTPLTEAQLQALISALEEHNERITINANLLSALSSARLNDEDAWRRLNNIFGRHRLNNSERFHGADADNPDNYILAFEKYDLPNLLIPIAMLSSSLTDGAQLASRRHALIRVIGTSERHPQTPKMISACAVLKVLIEAEHRFECTDELVDAIFADDEDWCGVATLADAMEGPLSYSDELLELLTRVVRRLNQTSSSITGLMWRRLLEMLDQRKSGLQSISTWKDLGLPEEAFSALSLSLRPSSPS